jgi:Rrf2 family nitric oxide-sensitive transcriptional repressor
MAIHGLWALARLEGQHFVLLSELARTQHVSGSYLAKVFQQLSHAGLVRAVRGKRGGYALARPPVDITIGDVVRALEVDAPMYQCLAQERCCEAKLDCLLVRVFAEAEQQMYAVLDKTTLADLLADFQRGMERMSWLQATVTLMPSLRTSPPGGEA